MNVWRRGSLTDNPYHRTAFRVARVPPEVVKRAALVTRINQARQIAAADPQAHTINGVPVTAADINAAEQVLLDPARRVAEELLQHATEKPPLERVRALAREVAGRLEEGADLPLTVTNLEGLREWAEALVGEFLEAGPLRELSFGAPELTPVPPFGLAEED